MSCTTCTTIRALAAEVHARLTQARKGTKTPHTKATPPPVSRNPR